MTETIKIDSLELEGKAFVFDNTIAEFVIGNKRYFHDEYDQLKGYPYDGYYGEDDPENSVVKAVMEAGGIVRRSISGKTDYYVVGIYDNKSKDYQKQKEKGKPVAAIALEDLKRILGLEAGEEKTKDIESELVDIYDPSGQSAVSYAAENIEIADFAVTGKESSYWEYSMEGDPEILYIRDYIGDKEDITIPTSIDGKKVYLPPQFPNTPSFPKCKAKTIRIPGSFNVIPVGFLEYNECIEEIIVGTGVEVIETNFCFNATNLCKVHFPDSIKEVGGWILKGTAWYENQGTEVIVGNVLIHKYADEFPANDAGVYSIPEGIAVIAGYAFYEENSNRNPSYINRIELPESVRYISEFAFFMLKMSSIKMPSSVEYIGKSAFNGTYLRSYYEEKQYFIIGDLLYELIPNEPVAVIPEGVKKVADEAISNYSAGILEELILPESLEVIGKAGFAGCINLRTVKFGNNLKTIGDYAFSGCSSLINATIPESVESIGEHAFG